MSTDLSDPRRVQQTRAVVLLARMAAEVRRAPVGITAIGAREDGGIIVYLGPEWDQLEGPGARAAALEHELVHAACAHDVRRGDREPLKWNLAADLAVHHVAPDIPARLGRLPGGGEVWTFHRAGISPCRAEIAYELLQIVPNPGMTCGRDAMREAIRQAAAAGGGPTDEATAGLGPIVLSPGEARALAEALGNGTAEHAAGLGPGAGRAVEAIPPAPAWIGRLGRLLARITDDLASRAERRRSYRRGASVRVPLPALLPQRLRERGPRVQLLIDASGSMTDDDVARALAVARRLHSHAEIAIRAFSDAVSPPYDSPAAARAWIAQHGGGGTRIRHAAEIVGRRSREIRLWITDAESSDGLPPADPCSVWVVTRDGGEPQIRRGGP